MGSCSLLDNENHIDIEPIKNHNNDNSNHVHTVNTILYLQCQIVIKYNLRFSCNFFVCLFIFLQNRLVFGFAFQFLNCPNSSLILECSFLSSTHLFMFSLYFFSKTLVLIYHYSYLYCKSR